MSIRLHYLPSLLAILILLTSCAASASQPTPTPTLAPIEQFARQSQLIADATLILGNLPPDMAADDVAAPPAPADPAAIEVWANPSERWRELTRRAATLDGQDSAGIQATLDMLDSAISDGLALAEAARAQGHMVADDAVLAEIAWRLIAQRYPLRADEARATAETAAWIGSWRGTDSASAVISGRLLGAAIASAVAKQLPGH